MVLLSVISGITRQLAYLVRRRSPAKQARSWPVSAEPFRITFPNRVNPVSFFMGGGGAGLELGRSYNRSARSGVAGVAAATQV